MSEVCFRKENQESIFDCRASASYGERERKKKKGSSPLSLSIPFFRLLHLAGHDFTCLRALAERPASHEQKGQGKVLYLSYCSSCLP